MKMATLSRVKPMKGLLVLLVLIGTIHCVYLSEKYGGRDMVDLYVALIIAGRRTFDRVPVKFKQAVKDTLAALGLDENGNPIEEV